MSAGRKDIGGDVSRYLHRRIEGGTDVIYRVDVPEKAEILLMTSPQDAPSPEAAESPTAGMTMAELQSAVSACTRCALAGSRTNTVFGDGDPRAGIVFVGEAPGRDEDLQGVPFVGRAGKLLDKMIAAIGFSRSEVYIANILKCRPPNNRDPLEGEVDKCEDYLRRQIELIDPAVICALGRVAAQNLLKTKTSLGRLREGIHYYGDTRVIVTYHPAALLRNPRFKRPAWEDLQLLKKIYDEDKGSG